MSLQNVYPWIKHAQQHAYAVGAFNANTLEQMQAIVKAAQIEEAPVIIQISHRALFYAGGGNTLHGLQVMAAMGQTVARSVRVPVSLHLDHAGPDEILQTIALGFTSVMFDGGGLPFDVNVATTARLSRIAHDADVCIEAEVGEVPKPDGATFDRATIQLTGAEEAEAFVRDTGVDLLAIALESVHGLTQKSLSLDLGRLSAIRDHVSVPLVLHGASGVLDNDIAAAIELGVSKVNVATQLNKAFTGAVRAVLVADGQVVDPRKYLGPGREAQIAVVRERIQFCGATGKANIVSGVL